MTTMTTEVSRLEAQLLQLEAARGRADLISEAELAVEGRLGEIEDIEDGIARRGQGANR